MTKNFDIKEFACPCCGEVVADFRLVAGLQSMRDVIGAAITITSGYRCPAHNKDVGGAANSQHLRGIAADIAVSGMAPITLLRSAETIPDFAGFGLGGSFVHVDVRRGARVYWKYIDGKAVTCSREQLK